MGVLSQAFEKADTQKDFLSKLFSSPVVRGFYKNEKPVVDVQLAGGKYERRRMTSLINTIAKNSPTGRKILEDAAKAGYTFGFERQSGSYGFCSLDRKEIRLNPTASDTKLTATLAHEARHAQQHTRGVQSPFCTFDVATELKLRRATEADAQAAAAQVALEIRAATKNESVWKSFAKADEYIARNIEKPDILKPLDAVVADSDATMRAAFKGWFNNANIVDAYEQGYLYAHLARAGRLYKPDELAAYFAKKPFEGSKSSAEIVAMVCTNADGKSYFANDPHIMDREKRMCGICKETRDMADAFFREREKITGKPADTSYKGLPDRGSLFAALAMMMSMMEVKAPKNETPKKDNRAMLLQARLRQGR